MADCAQGQLVPREVGIVYLHDLKHVLDRFRGFAMEELAVLYDTFSVRKFNAGSKVFGQGAPADSFALILHGRAQLSRAGPSGLPVVFDSAEEGDMVGHQALFLSGVEEVVHTATLTATAAVNIVMLCKFEQVMALNSFNQTCGMQMMRMVAEAACARVFCPMGVPMRPDLAELVPASSERAQLASTIQSGLQDHTLFRDLNPEQTATLLDEAMLVRFHRGHQVFHQGAQARCLLMLVSGQLEVRGPSGERVCSLSKAGEVVGDALLPLVVHKGDTFALSEVTMLAFTMRSIRKINDARPELGAKLVRNAMNATLAKMKRMFRAGGSVFDPERPDTSKLEEELAELRELASSKLQRVLHLATVSLLGAASLQEMRSYAGEQALRQLEDVVRQLADKVARREEEMLTMVPKSELKAAQLAVEKQREAELAARREIRELGKQMQGLSDELTAWQQKHRALEATMAEKELEIQETEAQLANERDMGRQLAKRLRDLRSEGGANSEGASRAGGSDDAVWRLMVKQQQENLEAKEEELQQCRMQVSELQFQTRNLKQQVARMEKLEERRREEEAEGEEEEDFQFLQAGDMEQLEQFHMNDVAQLRDNVESLQRDLRSKQAAAAALRWQTLVGRIQSRWQVKSVLSEFLSQARQKDFKAAGMSAELGELRAQLDNFQDQQKISAHSRANPLVPQPPPIAACEHDSLAESVSELEGDLAHVCRLSCWLVVHISRAETAAGRLVLPWSSHVVQLLDMCWEVMFVRKMLSEEARSLDMDTILSDRTVKLPKSNIKPIIKPVLNPTPCRSRQPEQHTAIEESLARPLNPAKPIAGRELCPNQQNLQSHQILNELSHGYGSMGRASTALSLTALEDQAVLQARSLTSSQNSRNSPLRVQRSSHKDVRSFLPGHLPDGLTQRLSTSKLPKNRRQGSSWHDGVVSRSLQGNAAVPLQVDHNTTMPALQRSRSIRRVVTERY